MRSHSVLLDFSHKLFRQFLKAYPPEHHKRFNEEMSQDFRDLCDEVLRERGLWGFMNLWMSVGLDLIKTAFEEQFKVRTNPTLEKMVGVGIISAYLSGAASILLAFTHASPNWIQWAFRLKWFWFSLGGLNLLVLVGLASHQVLHNVNIGVGYWMSLLGVAFMTITGIFMPIDIQIWRLYSYGIDILGVGFLAQCISAFIAKSSLRWSATYAALGISILAFNQVTPPRHLGLFFAWDGTVFACFMGLTWMIFGLVLFGSQKQEKQF